MKQLTMADSLCNPTGAPAPEAANTIADSMALLRDFVNSMEVAVRYEEALLGVSGSASEPSHDSKHKKCDNKCNKTMGGRH